LGEFVQMWSANAKLGNNIIEYSTRFIATSRNGAQTFERERQASCLNHHPRAGGCGKGGGACIGARKGSALALPAKPRSP
jgi:hypothetical protein